MPNFHFFGENLKLILVGYPIKRKSPPKKCLMISITTLSKSYNFLKHSQKHWKLKLLIFFKNIMR